MSNTGPWCVFGATHSREAQKAYLFLNFFKNFDFSPVPPSPLCPWWSPCLLLTCPCTWQPSWGLPGDYSCSCFRFRNWPMIGNQTETWQVPRTTENRSQNNITIFLLWFPLCPASGNISSFCGVKAEPCGGACSYSDGKTGLGDVPLSLLSSYLPENSIGSSIITWVLSEPFSQVCVRPEDKSETISHRRLRLMAFVSPWIWKGLATYTLMFLFVVIPTHATQTRMLWAS